MSNIRNFPGVEASGEDRVNQKMKRRKTVRFYKIFIVVVVLLLVFLFLYIFENVRKYSKYQVTKTYTSPIYDGSTVTYFDGNILTYGKDGANVKDTEGNTLWNITYDMQNPIISMDGGTVAFADYTGNLIYMVSSAKESYEITTDMPILKLAVSRAGYVVAVLDDSDVTWVYMYDVNGRVIAYSRTTMEKSGFPMDVTVSSTGEIVGVSYYYIDTDEKNSKIAFYNFGEVGQNDIDNYVSGYVYDGALVPTIKFMGSDRAFALSTDRIAFFEGEHKPVSISDVFLTDSVVSLYYSDTYIGLVFNSTGEDGKYILKLYNTSGKETGEISFDYDYSGIVIKDNTVVIYGDTNFTIGNVNGKVHFQGNYSDNIELIVPSNSKTKFSVVTEYAVDTVELK